MNTNENTFNELDSFSSEIMQRVRSYKQQIDEALEQTEDEKILPDNQTIRSISPIKSSEESCDGDGSCSSVDIPENQEFSTAQVKDVHQSIKKLLNVLEHNDGDDDDDDDDDDRNVDDAPEIDIQYDVANKNSRLLKRLDALTKFYHDEDYSESVRPKKFVLKEQNQNAEMPKSVITIKDRLKSIAELYYPIKSGTETNEIKIEQQVTIHSKQTNLKPQKDFPKSNIVGTPEKCSNGLMVAEKKQVMKQTSVADLKKIFEAKINQSSNEDGIKPLAPELLPVREKKRLFEKAIREEHEARAKQYKKNINSQKQPFKESFSHDDKIINSPICDQVVAQDKVSMEISPLKTTEMNMKSSIEQKMDETNCKSDPNTQQSFAESDCEINKQISLDTVPQNDPEIDMNEQDSADLTFSAIDNDNLSIVCPGMENTMHRSSTRVDLKPEAAGKSVDSVTELTSLEKPIPLFQDTKEPEAEKNLIKDFDDESEFEPEPNTDVDETPFLRTISSYRRQQNDCQNHDDEKCDSKSGAPKVINLKQKLTDEEPERKEIFRTSCQKRIVALKQEVGEHDRVLRQAQRALNLSLSTPDLRNSESRIEAERLLLVAAEKRNACLREIERLKTVLKNTEFYMKRCNSAKAKGTLSISQIELPFLDEFLVARAKGKASSTYYFIFLIYHEATVLVSEVLASSADLAKQFLQFKLAVKISDLMEDFKITIKLFSLDLSIKDSKQSKQTLATPFKSIRRKLMASPSLVRSASAKDKSSVFKPILVEPESLVVKGNFKMIGSVLLTLNEVKAATKLYRLDGIKELPSIIENYLKIETSLDVNYLTSFHGYFDIQEPFKTYWNLRWFSLQGPKLMFWRFEEDKSKPPMGIIDLKHCINAYVNFLKPDQRHLCMRPHTFVLVTLDPPMISNTEKLLKGGVITKLSPKMYLISSQSKSDGQTFCLHLNQTLRSIRIWETDTIQAYSCEEFDRLLLNCHQ